MFMIGRRATPPILRLGDLWSVRICPRHCCRAVWQRHYATAEGKEGNPKLVRGQKVTPFTTETYPELKRNSKYARLNKDDARHFADVLGPSGVIDGLREDRADDLEAFNVDWMGKYRGRGQLVLKPHSTQQVSEILRYCNDRRLAVVPQGGNTGLVGGSNPIFDEVILSLSRMNKIRQFDEVSGAFVCDAGVILEQADQFLAGKGHIFPLDLGAKGSCQVGGNVSTNAGGLRLLRYGSLHGNVIGLECVLADGTILDELFTLRKNNTGYDLKQLFIGSEGTLGVVTGVSIICPRRPSAVNVAFVGLSSFEQVQKAFIAANSKLQEILSAFEFLDDRSREIVVRHTENKFPLEKTYPFYALIETSGSSKEHDDAKLEAYLEQVMTDGIVEDGTVAQDETQIKAIWGWREGVTEAVNKTGGTYKYDVSIPLDHLYELVEATRKRLEEGGVIGESEDFPARDCVGYGHLGDNNLHLNIGVRRYDKRVEELLEPFVYEWIARHHGSISAEHGIGIAKQPYISYTRNDVAISMMKGLKQHFDPNAILNPYKIL